jgi:carbonic anhydrase
MAVTIDGSAGVTYPAGTIATVAGVGDTQTWQNVAASRVLGTTYTNSTGRPIAVSVQIAATTNGTSTIVVAGVTVCSTVALANAGIGMSTIVPAGATYVVDNNQASKSINVWAELR